MLCRMVASGPPGGTCTATIPVCCAARFSVTHWPARSQQVSAETDAVGTEVISDLGVQRESLQRTRERLADTDVELGRSQRLLRTMYIRVLSNKVLLVAIIVAELALLGAAIYLKFFKK